jgi:microsomal epoxide hydrolase
MEITPFHVNVSQEILDDLAMRLKSTRWPDEIPNSGWDYGTNRAYIKGLLDYWGSEFNWRVQENAINGFPNFRANIDGLNIHFIHERGKGPNPLPIIITHGWPSSFYEMLKIIPFLTDPASHGGESEDSFDVVVPSLPGYGFSDRPHRPGMTNRTIADLWAEVMSDLGYDRFGAYGGDIGAGVTAWLGLLHPKQVVGIHVTSVREPYLGEGVPPLSEAEKAYVALQERWNDDENGYGHIQSTRPQTLAYGLNDSPAGLAAWIVEKFRAWSDCDGDVEKRFTKDELLTNITIYWVTQTINSSVRLYYEHKHNPRPFKKGERIEIPCGVALTKEEVDHAPREWAERTYNIQHWTELPSGGHFVASEEPKLLAEDIRSFFRRLRNADAVDIA